MIQKATMKDLPVLAEFASDCELTNGESLCFHMHVGFAEVNRIICFAKKL